MLIVFSCTTRIVHRTGKQQQTNAIVEGKQVLVLHCTIAAALLFHLSFSVLHAISIKVLRSLDTTRNRDTLLRFSASTRAHICRNMCQGTTSFAWYAAAFVCFGGSARAPRSSRWYYQFQSHKHAKTRDAKNGWHLRRKTSTIRKKSTLEAFVLPTRVKTDQSRVKHDDSILVSGLPFRRSKTLLHSSLFLNCY